MGIKSSSSQVACRGGVGGGERLQTERDGGGTGESLGKCETGERGEMTERRNGGGGGGATWERERVGERRD